MNETVIKIKSGQYANLTYENDQYYNLVLKDPDYDIINGINQTEFFTKKELVELGEIDVYARYVGKSRIDGCPLFAIDIKSEIRRNKIEKITQC